MLTTNTTRSFNAATLCVLAAVTMAYGWGYRGVVGHEGGAMVPGAMLGMVICLASGRLDWYRRAAVAGLFGAVGWAWGGSLSYMEHTLYVQSDSFPNVLYGYAVLFFLGALWAGIGGAILGLTFTEKRSELQRYVGPFTAVCAVFLVLYIYFFFDPGFREAYDIFTVEHFHDGDWLSALITLIVSSVYWFVRPKDRPATALFFWCAVAWWIGYLGFTKFGGLLLAPPFRSESWGGVVGILVVLIIYLVRRNNRAALMLCLYGIVGGGIAFALAVFIRHPLRVEWGPFATWGGQLQWKLAEESFGFFMGLAIALGAVRLLRGGLAPQDEDAPRKPLDVYAVFVVLIALMWVNLRRGPMKWVPEFQTSNSQPFIGISPWMWYVIGGALASVIGLVILYQYYRGELTLAPSSAYGKGAVVFLVLLWLPAIGAFIQHLPNPFQAGILVNMSFWVLAAIASLMVLAAGKKSLLAKMPSATTAPSDLKWQVGWRYGLLWAVVPVFLIAITGLSMSMQDGPFGRARTRFGPQAYHRQVQQLVGTWDAVAFSPQISDHNLESIDSPIQQLEFTRNRQVTVTMADGERIAGVHTWTLHNPYMRIAWYGNIVGHPERRLITLYFYHKRMFVPWTIAGDRSGYLVFSPVSAGLTPAQEGQG